MTQETAETVVLRVRITKEDYDTLSSAAGDTDISTFARLKLAEVVPGISGTVNAQGGVRKGAGRKPGSKDKTPRKRRTA